MSDKFYAVKVGRQVGIFNVPWEKVRPLVERYPGATYRGFASYAEASKYFYGSDESPSPSSELVVYTDGSCIRQRGGYAVVVVRPDGTHICYSGRVPYEPCTNQKAELYAILMALRKVEDPSFILRTDSKYGIGCCTEWLENWKRTGWKKPVENRELIEQIDVIRGDRKITFEYVSAHTGVEFNELCDALAKAGTEQPL